MLACDRRGPGVAEPNSEGAARGPGRFPTSTYHAPHAATTTTVPNPTRSFATAAAAAASVTPQPATVYSPPHLAATTIRTFVRATVDSLAPFIVRSAVSAVVPFVVGRIPAAVDAAVATIAAAAAAAAAAATAAHLSVGALSRTLPPAATERPPLCPTVADTVHPPPAAAAADTAVRPTTDATVAPPAARSPPRAVVGSGRVGPGGRPRARGTDCTSRGCPRPGSTPYGGNHH